MTGSPIALLVGLLTGFLGAIPPGPLNVTIMRKASQRELRAALRVSIGGALVDALICGALGMGMGWALDRLLNDRWVRLVLALFLVAYGVKILVVDRKRDAEALASKETVPDSRAGTDDRLGFHLLIGFLHGAANPAVVVNWTLVISFLVSHRLLGTGPGPKGAFALGVGLGVLLWFLLLVELIDRLRDHPAGEWIRKSTFVAALLLIGFGLFFLARSVEEMAGLLTIGP